MSALASVRRHDATAADRVQRWRERKRLGLQAQPNRRQAPGAREDHVRDVGPAIAEGEPFVDDFTECEAKWTAAFGAERTASFTDEPAPRF